MWCLDLWLHLKAFEFTVWTKKFYIIILYRPCIFPSAPLPTSLLFYHSLTTIQEKEHSRNKPQERFLNENKHRNGTLKTNETKWKWQTKWEWHHNTFTLSLHLVPFYQQCTQKTFCIQLSLLIYTKCSLHSLPHKRQSISAMFSSKKKFTTQLLCTQLTQRIFVQVGKMAQDIGLVWKCWGVISIYLVCLVF